MAVVNDPASAFDFAYKGFQYPLPPSWKYAVRQQDQIYWLLQAIMFVNAHGISTEYLEERLGQTVDELTAAINSGDAELQAKLDNAVAYLEDMIRAINAGLAYSRNPVTGMFDVSYVVFKQMYDMVRTYACTWDELDALDMTWDELKETGHTWFEVDMFGHIYWGDGEQRAKYTPVEHIDTDTPGYLPANASFIARTWAEIAELGFLTRRED